MNDQALPLYIGSLPESITEAELSQFFQSKSFQLTKVVLGKPRNNGRQFAFVYTNSQDASKILEQLNYEKIRDREMTIMKYNPDAQKIRLDLNIFVRGLPPGTTSRDLHDKIHITYPKATIESAKVGRDKNGNLLNYGYVHFNKSCESTVKELIQKGFIAIGDVNVEVKEYKRRTSETSNLYLKEFPKDWSIDTVNKWIKDSGCEPASTFIPEKEKSSIKGFAFADFGTYEKAISFIAKVCGETEAEVKSSYTSDDSNFRSKDSNIYISRALSRRERNSQLMRKQKLFKKELRERTRNKNLYVNNFPDDYDDNKLGSLFSEFGKITSAKVMLDDSSKSKGFGFVCFDTSEDAKKAITGRHNTAIGNKKLTVCIAESKSARRKKLSQQYYLNQFQHPYPVNYQALPPQPAPLMQYGRTRMPAPFPQYPSIPMRPMNAYPPMPQQPHFIPQPQPQPQPPQQQQERGGLVKDYGMLIKNKTPEEQRDILGEIIYKIAQKEDVDTAPKITGMLLELDIADIVQNLNYDHMASKILEARTVLNENKS